MITAYCFSAGCCHGTVQSDLLYPSVLKKTRIPTGRPSLPFFWRLLGFLLAGLLFFFLILDVVLLLTLLPHQSDRHVATTIEERLVSFLCFLSLFSWRASGLLIEARISLLIFSTCYFSSPSFGRILRALELIFALPAHWEPLTMSLTFHLLDDVHTVVWLCLATCWRRTSERIWVLARCMLSSLSCFTWFNKVQS